MLIDFSRYAGRIKPDTLEGLKRYVINHVPPGGFLHHVLANDLMKAVGKADEGNEATLRAICELIWNNFPEECYGDYEKVREWTKIRVVTEEEP